MCRVCRDHITSNNVDVLKTKANSCTRIVVFSGSGLSATSGMSTFSTKGGLYERAKSKYKLADGKNLFTYSFYRRNRKQAEAFLADVYLEALEATPAPGHYALAALANSGKMVRHYTLNIDGLASKAGMDVWDPEKNPSGMTVEMHGSIHEMVCTSCGNVSSLDVERAGRLREEMPLPCDTCQDETSRFRVMMYDDADGEYITPDDVMDLMEEDIKEADLILWVGISFQQSASTAYFRNTRHWLQEVSKHEAVVQAVINPSEEALWNVLTALSNQRTYPSCLSISWISCLMSLIEIAS